MNNIYQNKIKKIVQEVFNKASDNYDLMNDLMFRHIDYGKSK